MDVQKYVVSRDTKSGLWYAHLDGYSYLPVAGSFCEKRSDAKEYANMYNGLPHRVGKIEAARRGDNIW